MVSFTSCVSGALDVVKRASFQIVRAVRQRQRQASRNVAPRSAFRLIGLGSTPPVAQVAAPIFLDGLRTRKRKYEEGQDSMGLSKKRCLPKPTWHNEAWAKIGRSPSPPPREKIERPKEYEDFDKLLGHLTYQPKSTRELLGELLLGDRKRRLRKTRNKFKTFLPKYKVSKPADRKRSKSPSLSIHLTRSPKWQHYFFDSDIEQTPSPQKQQTPAPQVVSEVMQRVEKTEVSTREQSYVPTQEEVDIAMAEFGPIVLPDEENEDWDSHEDPSFREVMRALPSSTGERGFKIPINGWVSPETQRWNFEHAIELAKQQEVEERAAVNDTPSRNPNPPSIIERARQLMPTWSVFKKDPNRTGTSFVGEATKARLTPSQFETVQNRILNNTQGTKAEGNTSLPLKSAAEKETAANLELEIKKEELPVPTPTEATSTEDTVVKAESSVQKSVKILSEHSPSEEKAGLEAKDLAASMKKEKTEPNDQQTPQKKAQAVTFQTPINQLINLNIHDDDDEKKRQHTPKAREFAARSTRAQKTRDEREAAKDLYKLAQLGPEWTNQVKAAAVSGTGELKEYDIARAVPQYSRARNQDNWLNDEVINTYLGLVAKHGRQGDRDRQVPTHHAFSSFFYTKLAKDGPDSVLRWSKRAKVGGKSLLETEKLFIPINEGMHWKLCVVEAKKHKKITVFNSLGTSRGQQVCDMVLEWIQKELGKDFNKDDWTLDPAGLTSQQTNSDDCGVFTVTTARQIMLGKMGTIEAGKMPDAYPATIIPIQRQRIVAELINQGLLTEAESKK